MRSGGAEVEGDFRSDLSNVQNEVTKSNYVTPRQECSRPKKRGEVPHAPWKGGGVRDKRWGDLDHSYAKTGNPWKRPYGSTLVVVGRPGGGAHEHAPACHAPAG